LTGKIKAKKTLKKVKKQNPKKLIKKSAKKPKKTAQRKAQKPSGVKKPKKLSPLLKQKAKEKEIGVVTHYFGKISVGIIKLKSAITVGDKIHIKGVHDDFTQSIDSMQYNHKNIQEAKKGLEIGIKVIQRVHENDKVYFAK
jgi:putative protease